MVSPVFAFGPFRLDAARRTLERDGQAIAVPGKALDILLVLLQHPGEVVDKDTLMREVWPGTVVEENNLTVHISGLRKALGDAAASPRLIITVSGRGYRFAGDLSVPPPAPLPMPAPATSRRRRWGLIAAAAALVTLASGVAWWRWSLPTQQDVSIAILPLRLLNSDPANEYLGPGLSDALITRLATLHNIVVRPLADVARMAGRDPFQAGREAGAAVVLDGAVQQSGDRIRVNVRLLRVRDRTVLWADSFDGATASLFDLEDSISTRVAGTVLLNLSGDHFDALAKRYTSNPEAYADYLRGRYYAARYTPEGFRKGLEYLQKAIDSDPGYALAYSGLADAYYDASNIQLPPSEAMPKSKAAAQRAIALDPALAEAHVSLGLAASKYDWNWREAEQEFQSALALNPNSAAAHQWYGLFRAQMGDTAAAIAELRKAQELDPLSSDINSYLGTALYWARRNDEAARQERKTIDFDPGFAPAHVGLCWVLEAQAHFAEAVAECEKGSGAAPGSWSSLALARAQALSGERTAAQQSMDRVLQAGGGFVSGYDLAVAYAALGRNDDAFRALDEAYQSRAEWMSYLKIDPQVDSLRADPRFGALLRRMGW